VYKEMHTCTSEQKQVNSQLNYYFEVLRFLGGGFLTTREGGNSKMVLVYYCLEHFHPVRHVYIMFF